MSILAKNILLVEDEAIIALNEIKQLTKAGYTVAHALSGEDAIELIDAQPSSVDLVLMDINLGAGMDGTEAAEVILKKHDIPLLFLSSHMEPSVVQKTEEITNYGYVVKSSSFTVLDASIKMAFKLFSAMRQLDLDSMEISETNEKLQASLTALQKANESLRLSEDKFEKAFQASPDPITITSLEDGRYITVNRGFTARLGYTEHEVLGRSCLSSDLSIWKNDDDRKRLVEELLEKGEVNNFEAEFRRKDGSIAPGLLSERIISIDGEPCVLSITRDIGDLKRSQKALFETERNFETAFDNSAVGIAFSSLDGKLRRANQRLCEMLGYSDSEIQDQDSRKFSFSDSTEVQSVEAWKTLPSGKKSRRSLNRLLHKDGHFIWVDMHTALVCDEKGKPDYFISHVFDITEKKRSDEELKLKSRLLDCIEEAVFAFDDNGRIFYCNDAASQQSGYGHEELVGISIDSLHPQEEGYLLRQVVEEMSKKGSIRYRTSQQRKNGTSFPVEIECVRTADSILFAIERDISQEKKWETMLATSPDGIAEVSKDGKLVFASPQCNWMLGYDVGETIVGRSIASFIASGEIERAGNFIGSLLQNKNSYPAQFTLLKKDGSTLLTEINPGVLGKGEDSSLLLIIRDISESVQKDLEYVNSRNRYLELLRTIGEGFCYFDRDFIFRMANPASEQIFGTEENLLLGHSLFDFVLDKDRDFLLAEFAGAKGKRLNCNTQIRRPDGKCRWLQVNSNPFIDKYGEFLGGSAIFRDISDEVTLNKELHQLISVKETLMKELEHRVKNSFVLISSLLGIAKNEITDPKAIGVLTDTKARITAISSIYEQLYLSGSVETIDFGIYITRLASDVIQTFVADKDRIRLAVQTISIELDTKRAISLGIVLNELLTNAIKYAFPNNRKGSIIVRLEAIEDDIILSVDDDGVGFAEATSALSLPTMGMTLIKLLSEQLEARIEFDTQDGTSIAITMGKNPG